MTPSPQNYHLFPLLSYKVTEYTLSLSPPRQLVKVPVFVSRALHLTPPPPVSYGPSIRVPLPNSLSPPVSYGSSIQVPLPNSLSLSPS